MVINMVEHVNNETFEKEVVQSDIPVIVDFWAAWCGPCQMMGPVFEELAGEYEDKLKFVKVSTEEAPEIAQKYGVQGIPSLIVMKNGEEVERIVGFNPKDALKQKIDSILNNL